MPLAEKALIARIKKLTGNPGRRIIRGIGDDCAVLRPPAGRELVITTDLMLEDVHFRRDWHPADSVGHKCLARGLSDIAAMGAEPMATFLSLGLPAKLPQSWADDFLRGFLRLAKNYNVTLAGGDVAESKSGIVADIMVVGSVPSGKAIMRSGARAGDIIYVTGALGAAAATLQQLSKHGRVPHLREAKVGVSVASARGLGNSNKGNSRHFYPDPRLAVAQYLRANNLATSMIDLSDGLSTDLAHTCEESKCGASLVADLVPIAKGADSRPGSGLERALHGGEDYELLFTAKNSARVPVEIAGVPVTEIGWITKEKGMRLLDGARKPTKLEARGWEHFRPGG
jgi:thiamine-monophosphate kinase